MNNLKKNMKTPSKISRYTLLWVILLSYLLPILSLIVYETNFETSKSWSTLAIGFFLCTLCSLGLFWILQEWEFRWLNQISSTDPFTSKDFLLIKTLEPDFKPDENLPTIDLQNKKIQSLENSLNEALLTNQILRDERDLSSNEICHLTNINNQQEEQLLQTNKDFEYFQHNSLKQHEEQQERIQELQDTIADQKTNLEKKQQQINVLEAKVNALTNEIKTLLHFAEAHNHSFTSEASSNPALLSTELKVAARKDEAVSQLEKQIQSSEEASQQLKRCLDIAQKITGSQRFGNQNNSFLDSTANSYTIDLRRLCDTLRSENNCPILLYSPKSNQLLFVNNQIKILTGWSPEKFVQNFNEILLETNTWKQGISSLAGKSEAQINVSLKTKTGQNIKAFAHLGMIPTGIFRHHIIAIIFTK